MIVPLEELKSYISIGDIVQFKSVEQIANDPSFGCFEDYTGFSTIDKGQIQPITKQGPWMHIPSNTYVYVFPNYTASPGEEFVISGCRMYEYEIEEPEVSRLDLFSSCGNEKRNTTLLKRKRKGYFFELEKVGSPNIKLFGVLHEALIFKIRYGNVRCEFEVK